MEGSHWLENTKPRDWWNGLLAIPALLGWVGYGLAILLAPHLAAEPDPLMWAAYAAGGWFALMFVAVGGWFALLALSLSA